MAVMGIARARREGDSGRVEVLLSPIEHHAVLEAAQSLVREGFSVLYMPMGDNGAVDGDAVAAYIREHAATLAVVSLMSANNETGVIQPVHAVARASREASVPFHSDMVPVGGLWPWFIGSGMYNASVAGATSSPTAESLDYPDAMTFSAHKLGGPIGIGALALRRGTPITPTTFGGGQEYRLRSGTIPTPLVASFAAAVREVPASLTTEIARLESLHSRLETLLTSIGALIVGEAVSRVPTTTCALFPGCSAESLLMVLDQVGVSVSTGSACTAGVTQPSHVLMAIGYDEATARSALRFSLGWTSTQADVDELARVLPDAVTQVSRMGKVVGLPPTTVALGQAAKAGGPSWPE
jgi:cysteine desulfurase